MKRLTKYLALRLLTLMLFPYSASAAAACHTQLDYGVDNGPDAAYEAAAYHSEQLKTGSACIDDHNNSVESKTGVVVLPSLSGHNDISL